MKRTFLLGFQLLAKFSKFFAAKFYITLSVYIHMPLHPASIIPDTDRKSLFTYSVSLSVLKDIIALSVLLWRHTLQSSASKEISTCHARSDFCRLKYMAEA